MQITCPNCGQAIRAENINVQELVAVCANCDTVFKFTAPEEKSKRRKVKQPEQLILRDAEKLEMSFRSNWRLAQNQDFIGIVIILGMTIFLTVSSVGAAIGGAAPIFIPIVGTLISFFLAYLLGLLVYNQTHIVMDKERISVSRKPLPTLSNQLDISLHGIEAIKCEETPVSKKEGYDLPRYRVWAETADGSRRPIVNDVTEEYAYFISQRLNERLHEDVDVSRLEDHAYQHENDLNDLLETQSQTDHL
jgi:hypothetical protein